MKHAMALSALALALSGCALTGKSEALDIHYFTPEPTRAKLTSAVPAAKDEALSLRLGRITSGKHLRERIVHRNGTFEVAFYDDKRWTENPEVYLRHALVEKLFERGGVTRAVGGPVPVLDAELLSFDEIGHGGRAEGRVALRIVLHDGDRVLVEDTIAVDEPVRGRDTAATVAAIANALDAATERAAEQVIAGLRR